MRVVNFESPRALLGDGDVDAVQAGRLIASASDVALVVNGGGVIRDVALGSDDLSRQGFDRWLGKPWAETVTVESRPKIEALLRDATPEGPTRWRHVNHPSANGPDLPLLYSAIRVSGSGPVVAFGRDMRVQAALQQRLVDAQQSMEGDYRRLRNAEARYRLLFRTTAEAVLIVDASTQKVTEANPAATRLLADAGRRGASRVFPDGLDAAGMQAVQDMLARVRAAGRADEVRARLAGSARDVVVSATLFREDTATMFIVRLATPTANPPPSPGADVASAVMEAIERGPDGFVVTSPEGRIHYANAAFLDLAQLATAAQANGQSLERWLGRPGVDMSVLLANLRQHGVVRLFATTVHGEYGTDADVEVSAAAVPDGALPCAGFAVRNVGRRLAADPRAGRELPRSVAQMTELVGRVPLKDLVRESTDVIERLCIEAALELTGDNRASAAEMLGLSRQSLYVKMHRYGLGDLAGEVES